MRSSSCIWPICNRPEIQQKIHLWNITLSTTCLNPFSWGLLAFNSPSDTNQLQIRWSRDEFGLLNHRSDLLEGDAGYFQTSSEPRAAGFSFLKRLTSSGPPKAVIGYRWKFRKLWSVSAFASFDQYSLYLVLGVKEFFKSNEVRGCLNSTSWSPGLDLAAIWFCQRQRCKFQLHIEEKLTFWGPLIEEFLFGHSFADQS